MEVENSCTGGTCVVGVFVFDLSRSFVTEIVISNRNRNRYPAVHNRFILERRNRYSPVAAIDRAARFSASDGYHGIMPARRGVQDWNAGHVGWGIA